MKVLRADKTVKHVTRCHSNVKPVSCNRGVGHVQSLSVTISVFCCVYSCENQACKLALRWTIYCAIVEEKLKLETDARVDKMCFHPN